MPRPLRPESTGAIYHVINRGDRRDPVRLLETPRPNLGQDTKKQGDYSLYVSKVRSDPFTAHMVGTVETKNAPSTSVAENERRMYDGL